MAEADPRLLIGANNPPPIEMHSLHIEELLAEAQTWLDGEPVSTQAQADDVAKLLGMLREAKQGADKQRAVEKKPHDDASKAVQAAWKPLIDRCDTAADVAKKALAPFLQAKEAEQRQAAEAARQAAARAREEAAAAQRAAVTASLAAREEADRLAREAEQAQRAATRAEKERPAAGQGRATSLRSVWSAVLIQPKAALSYYAQNRRDELIAFLEEQAAKDVRAGRRDIPGFEIKEERVPV